MLGDALHTHIAGVSYPAVCDHVDLAAKLLEEHSGVGLVGLVAPESAYLHALDAPLIQQGNEILIQVGTVIPAVDPYDTGQGANRLGVADKGVGVFAEYASLLLGARVVAKLHYYKVKVGGKALRRRDSGIDIGGRIHPLLVHLP